MSPLGNTVYSIGKISSRIKTDMYSIRSGTEFFVIHASGQTLRINQWIRFHGVFDGNVISCTYIESLDGIDIGLIFRYLNHH
jgi:hypothetical protein